ncbi:MAG: phosphotransferase [Bacteroidales bacterium]
MIQDIKNLFHKTFNQDLEDIEGISAHGSSRKYFRCKSKDYTTVAAYNDNPQENTAFIHYSLQLSQNQIKVPKVYSEDLNNNIYLIEDLGNTTLYDKICEFHNGKIDQEEIRNYYKQAISDLIRIQIIAGKDFDYTNAFPIKEFNSKAINWDLNYFKYYFLRLSNTPFNDRELEEDFETFVSYILNTDNNYFLFRDFQSRNIMVRDSQLYYIDYQGGRKGFLQYDLASLLFDAKARLSQDIREELLEYYIEELKKYKEVDINDFINRFYASVYLRIFQALGAYGYRGYFERKTHFLESIPYALSNLSYLQKNNKMPISLPYLNNIINSMIESDKLKEIHKTNLTIDIKSFSFKKGYPYDASGNGGGYIFDCRAINNPGRYEEYKSLNGKDREVIEFLEKQPETNEFFENTLSLVNQNINVYLKRGFTNLSVYYGCTGGQHRSVFFAEKLFKTLCERQDIDVVISHLEQKK